jgi:glycosyltransferase involved in cell wall biosynthesis
MEPNVKISSPSSAIRTKRGRYRLLLLAESANPEWASVPLIGWSLYRSLAKITDAHLVAQIRNRDALCRAGLVEGRDFTAVDSELVARPLWRLAERMRGGAGKGWTTAAAFSSLAYYAFELEVWRRLGERIKAREFDLVHRVTPLSPTSQSLIAGRLARQKIPFVIGPLNGGLPWPRNFGDRRRAEREWFSFVRHAYKLMPGYRSTHRNSAAVIAGSDHTYGELPCSGMEKQLYIPENGVDPDRFSVPRDRRATVPLRAAFVGRLVPYKGADMLIEATRDFQERGQLELHIIGDGPQRSLLETMVDQMGLRKSVNFHGWVAHHEVQSRLRTCDLMALPSIREFGGAVVLEAMALGVTPIVADYGGPSELVDGDTGVRVQFHDKASLVQGLRQSIEKFIREPDLLDLLGAAGRRKVLEKFTWDAKANQILQIYEAVVDRSRHLGSLHFGFRDLDAGARYAGAY